MVYILRLLYKSYCRNELGQVSWIIQTQRFEVLSDTQKIKSVLKERSDYVHHLIDFDDNEVIRFWENLTVYYHYSASLIEKLKIIILAYLMKLIFVVISNSKCTLLKTLFYFANC